MAWLLLLAAGLLEIGFALCLKASAGFSKPLPSIGIFLFGGLSLLLLTLALRSLPVGSAYAVWTGIGAAGTAAAGVVLFGESRDLLRLFSIAVILAGVVGLRLSGSD